MLKKQAHNVTQTERVTSLIFGLKGHICIPKKTQVLGDLALAGLRKDLLPDLEPRLLFVGEGTLRVPESGGEQIAETGVESL